MALLSHPSERASSPAEDEARALSLAARSDVGILLITLDMPPQVAYANPAALALLGCSEHDLKLGPESPLRPLLADWVSRTTDAGGSFETALPRAPGAEARCVVRSTSVELDDQAFEAFFLEDSALRGEQSRLERHERRFRSLIESTQEAVWICERHTLLYANPAALRLFGASSLYEVVGSDVRRFLHPEDHAELEVRFEQLDHGALQVAFECRARSPHKAWMTLEVSAIPIEYQTRDATLAFARDVTEQKELERRTRQHDRLTALGMLAGGIAHAINNPLSYVLLNLDHLAKELPRLGRDAGRRADALALIEQTYAGAERMAGVVRRMREFCRIDDAEPSPVDFGATVEAVVEMVGNEIRHRANLVTEIEEVPPVFGARPRLEQALLSLLIFVARSLPERDHASNEVHVRLRHDASHVLVDVRCHCPDGVLSGRVSASEAADLGLLACESIIAAAGGSVGIRQGSGTEPTVFHIALPTAADRSA